MGCQGGCERERRIEAIVKIQKKSGLGGRVVGGQGGCVRRSEFFVQIWWNLKKIRGSGRGWDVRLGMVSGWV